LGLAEENARSRGCLAVGTPLAGLGQSSRTRRCSWRDQACRCGTRAASGSTPAGSAAG